MELLVIAVVGVVAWLLWEGNHASPSLPNGGSGGLFDSSAGNDPLQNMAQAIFQFEGNGQPGATNSWNNNPGNVGGGQNAFSDVGDGWQALYNYITGAASSSPNQTLQQFFEQYLGQPGNSQSSSQGDPTAYANYVANYLGVGSDATLGSIVNGSAS